MKKLAGKKSTNLMRNFIVNCLNFDLDISSFHPVQTKDYNWQRLFIGEVKIQINLGAIKLSILQ